MALAYVATGSIATDAAGPTLNVPYAGSPAYGNLMVIHVQTQLAGDFSTPAGWTQLESEVNGGAVFYKIAAGGETGSVAVTSSSGAARIAGVMLLFEGNDPVTPISSSESDTDYTVPTQTPTAAGTIWVFMVGAESATATPSFSGYAMATNNPTWTERYDQAYSGQIVFAGATSSIRPETSATGDCTATITGTGASQNAFVFSIAPGQDVAIAADVLNIGVAKGEPAFTPNTLSMGVGVIDPAVLLWENQEKSSTSWTNQDKS